VEDGFLVYGSHDSDEEDGDSRRSKDSYSGECNDDEDGECRLCLTMTRNVGSRRLLLELEEVVAAAMVTVRWLAAAAAAAGECSAGVGSISVSVQEAAAAAGADAKADHQKQSSISNETMPIIENLLGLILVYRKWRINK
jgi:hypothetical protein